MEIVALLHDREETLRLERHDGHYTVTLGEREILVDMVHARPGVMSLIIEGQQHEVSVEPQGMGRRGTGRYQVSGSFGHEVVAIMDPLTHLAQQTRAGEGAGGQERVDALMPGQVVEILVAEGDTVEAGQGVLVLEAMKMKNEIQAERAGTVNRIFVEAGKAVEGGDPLFEIG